LDYFVADRMFKLQEPRMQGDAFGERNLAAVLLITQDGQFLLGQLHADLMFATGQQVDLE
jgi:hypothetical protein